MNQTETFSLIIPNHLAGKRLDAAIAAIMPDFSRVKIAEAIKKGDVFLNQKSVKSSEKVFGGESVAITLNLEQVSLEDAIAEDIPLDIVFEDEHILVLNKPQGLVIHPGSGNPSGTLMNGLLNYHPNARALPRAGIVHRLDKNTSGVMVVAKSPLAYSSLIEQLQTRQMGRLYHALSYGVMDQGQTIDAPIGRHHTERQKMSCQALGKPAITHIRVIKRFRANTYVQCQLETGRTHQIRVHMSFLRLPLIGDELYGARLRIPSLMSDEHAHILRNFKRQALHAKTLKLIHPLTQEEMRFDTPLAPDFAELLAILDADFLLNRDDV
ncbi:ribosomal large subunit pseudouridine synthase D [Gammaproteobacteria bacterium]|nr:ribosomal large subunit pseudouridine synthase D [Gammaproteobacteria bacterium]